MDMSVFVTGQFGSFEWSSSEGHILYMAEKKKPNTGSFFDPKAFKDVGPGGDEEVASGKSADVKRVCIHFLLVT